MSSTNVSIPGIGFIDPQTLLNCTLSTCPLDTSFYNYRINLGANIAFVVCFSIILFPYLAIWIFTRRSHFFHAAMVIGIVVEILGYAARIWSYYNQWAEVPYLIQIICLTLAPAFFSAGVYVCLGRIVIIYGEENSKLKPRLYTAIFIPCDGIALLLQGIGGGLAASALSTYDFDSYSTGTKILTAGLVWQVFTLLCFATLCLDFAVRVLYRVRKMGKPAALNQEQWATNARQSRLFHLFLPTLVLATVLIFWRCVYRVVELNDGFTGPVTFDQGLFVGFESIVIVVAVYIMVIAQPALSGGNDVSSR